MDYPFRVHSPATSRAQSAIRAHGTSAEASADTGQDTTRQYVGRVVKLIPAEVVTVYQGVHLVVENAAKATPPQAGAATALNYLPWIFAVLVIFVRGWGTRLENGKLVTVQWGAVAIATVSFFVWVISLGHGIAGLHRDSFLNIDISQPWIGSVLLILWPFFIPYLYKGD